jgi:hypothetical protein
MPVPEILTDHDGRPVNMGTMLDAADLDAIQTTPQDERSGDDE